MIDNIHSCQGTPPVEFTNDAKSQSDSYGVLHEQLFVGRDYRAHP